MRLPEYMIKGYEKWKIEMREAKKVLARYKITSLNRIPRIPQSGYTYIQSLQLRYQNLQGFHPPKRSSVAILLNRRETFPPCLTDNIYPQRLVSLLFISSIYITYDEKRFKSLRNESSL